MFLKFHIKDKEMTGTVFPPQNRTLGMVRDKCSNNERGNSRGHVTISMSKESIVNI